MIACGVICPGSFRLCQLPDEHEGEHRTELTPGRSYLYWEGNHYPVLSRSGVVFPAPSPVHLRSVR